MKLINQSECCGCGACANVCPHNCISFKRDDEGFLFPEINENKCVHCGLCEICCPVTSANLTSGEILRAYACKNKNNDVLMQSSSGGLFSILAEHVINNHGVVFGAICDESCHIVHSKAHSIAELGAMRGSKYVQSDIGNSFSDAKALLNQGTIVLFSGTSCQIAGLKSFLRKDYANLITVDVVCHGVASPEVFESYIEEKEISRSCKIKEISFRDKTEGWTTFSMRILFEDGYEYRKNLMEDEYLRGFIANLFLRRCCFDCKFKRNSAGSDISIADYWGIKKILPEFYEPYGVSMALIHTEKGADLFNTISPKIEFTETSVHDAITCNSAIVTSAKWQKKRKKFYAFYKHTDTCSAINKSLTPNLINKINLFVYSKIKK